MISAECILSALAHGVISLRCGAWSLWGHSGPCPDLPLAQPGRE